MHVVEFPVFLMINNILLYAYGACGLPIHLSVNMDVASIFGYCEWCYYKRVCTWVFCLNHSVY